MRKQIKQINRSFTFVLLLALALSLGSCGQKGGLTRPEQKALVSLNIASPITAPTENK
jgi:predicted small lipoprotein YifL